MQHITFALLLSNLVLRQSSILLKLLIILAACPKPGEGTNTGLVADDGGPYPAGDVYTYTCNSGYISVEYITIICEDDGTWSRVPPTCSGNVAKVFQFFCCNCYIVSKLFECI